jgi:hypothetical protein
MLQRRLWIVLVVDADWRKRVTWLGLCWAGRVQSSGGWIGYEPRLARVDVLSLPVTLGSGVSVRRDSGGWPCVAWSGGLWVSVVVVLVAVRVWLVTLL